jgi:PIN domain nuclease of toxin-antitoxin system
VTVLLDTHYVYAIAGAPGRLTATECKYLAEQEGPFSVSAVSIWEIRLKWSALFASGKRKGPMSPAQVTHILQRQGVQFLPLLSSHACAALQVPLQHNDPFDEVLLLQAQEEGLRLLTRDSRLINHPLAVVVS